MEEICALLQEAERILEEVERRKKELPENWPSRLYKAFDALRKGQKDILDDLVRALRPLATCNLGQTGRGELVLGYDVLELAGSRISFGEIARAGLFSPVAALLIKKIKETLQEAPHLVTVLRDIGYIVKTKEKPAQGE